MMRHCDGTDPNLRMTIATQALADDMIIPGKIVAGERLLNRIPGHPEFTEEKPCDCGYTFDDVDHFVFWPHANF